MNADQLLAFAESDRQQESKPYPLDMKAESEYCECSIEWSIEEVDWNQCDSCGKAFT